MSEAAVRRLSKSQYLRGLQCHKSLWLHNFRPDLRGLASPGAQHIFDQGHEVGLLAHQRFPGGVLIEADHQHIPEALQQTEAALKAGATILFEAAFMHDGVLVRPDVLVKAGARWDLIEVKSSTEVKEVYLPDVAIQRYVLDGAGLPVRKASLMHVDNRYVRQGAIDPERFFTLADLTRATAPVLAQASANLAGMRAVLAGSEIPDIAIGAQCRAPYDCDFMDFCWKHVPDYSVYNLKRAAFDKINELRGRGVMRIEDIPADFALSDAQEIQVRVAKSGEPHIDGPAIKKCLDQLVYPLFYLDFETVNPAIPPYDGMRPFQALPFQASLHVQDKPGEEPGHLEYLGDPKSDPRPGLVEFLVKSIGPKGSVVVYNAGFEGGRLGELAEAFPKEAKPLLAIKKRLWDLIIPFRGNHFVHPEMRGSASMKAVLPALVPGMSYDGLAISNGEMAFLAYEAMMAGKMSASQMKKTMAALREYCGQDTLGMVEILKVLRQYAA
jgi:hypothetical protein